MSNPLSRWLRSTAVLAAFLSGLGGLAISTQAVAEESVYFWSGSCLDCGPGFANVAGVLTLQDYTPGTLFEEGFLLDGLVPFDKFRSFGYNGSDLVDTYIVEAQSFFLAGAGLPAVLNEPHVFSADSVRGRIPDTVNSPQPGFLEITFDDGLFFRAAINGTWSTCAPGLNEYYTTPDVCDLPADFGNASVFSTTPVPEPGIWAMLAAGLGVVAFMRRRNNPVSVH